jgi:hypothetical protein
MNKKRNKNEFYFNMDKDKGNQEGLYFKKQSNLILRLRNQRIERYLLFLHAGIPTLQLIEKHLKIQDKGLKSDQHRITV